MDSVFWIKAAQLLTSLSILVLLHEFGHYLPAKLFGMKVEKFYLFFNPKFSLWKKKIGETVYGIGWVPLGGYVKIAGMIDESMDKEQMSKEPEPWEFRSKPAWQRMIVMLGGIIVNVILGYIIFIMVSLTWGKEYLPNENATNGFVADSLMIEAGFQNGDRIVAVEGEEINDFSTISYKVLFEDARTLTAQRADGSTYPIQLPDDAACQMVGGGSSALVAPRLLPIVDTVVDVPGIAKKAGMLKGDRILWVGDSLISFSDQASAAIKSYKGDTIETVVLRGADTVVLNMAIGEDGVIGVAFQDLTEQLQTEQIDYGFGDAVSAGVHQCNDKLYMMVKQFGLFTCEGAGAQVGGLGTMGSLFAPTWDWHSFWLMTGFLSIMLAILNLLPIPALDGGHVMFLLYEMITGRKPNEKFMEIMQYIGMFLLLGLILYANINDIIKWFS